MNSEARPEAEDENIANLVIPIRSQHTSGVQASYQEALIPNLGKVGNADLWRWAAKYNPLNIDSKNRIGPTEHSSSQLESFRLHTRSQREFSCPDSSARPFLSRGILKA